jgi:hypothetical protein
MPAFDDRDLGKFDVVRRTLDAKPGFIRRFVYPRQVDSL